MWFYLILLVSLPIKNIGMATKIKRLDGLAAEILIYKIVKHLPLKENPRWLPQILLRKQKDCFSDSVCHCFQKRKKILKYVFLKYKYFSASFVNFHWWLLNDSLQVIEECQKKITASPNLPYVVCELKALSNAKVDLSISMLFMCKTSSNLPYVVLSWKHCPTQR